MKILSYFKPIALYCYLFFFIVLSIFYYVIKEYHLLQKPINSIEIVFGEEVTKEKIPIVYISSDNESRVNFETVYKFQSRGNGTYVCQLDEAKKLRKLRLYFPYPNRTVLLKSVNLKSSENVVSIPLKNFKEKNGIKCIEGLHGLTLEILNKNGYIELPETYIYKSDFKKVYVLCLPLLLVWALTSLVFKSLKPLQIKLYPTLSNITVSLVVLSIFLPAPLYNIALIIMTILNLRTISWNKMKENKINFIILGFFLVYLVNNLFISPEGFSEMSTIERFLPFVILSVVFPAIGKRKYLYLFVVSSFAIGFVFLSTSIIDVFIFQNFVFMSFDYFTKHLHPVYFSYLLFFSICYVDLNYNGYKKYFLEFILFLFLIFSGSKMVLTFAAIIVSINFIKNIKTVIFITPLIVIVFFFLPLKDRFAEILKADDISVLKEEYINNPYDARINGLTMRLILWRETLATMSWNDYLVGKGVTKGATQTLDDRLYNLGMTKHIGFNPHNQYVDTFWRTGFVGLFFLILIPLYSLIQGVKRKDKLLIQFSLFLFAVMFSESIFGRVNGIYFFVTVILLLQNNQDKERISL